MKYDFISVMDRRGRDALAVDSVGENVWGSEPEKPQDGFDFIPMWVADMNFPTCPSVTEAIIKRVEHPAFGYFRPTEEYYDSIIRWQENHFGVKGLKKEYIGYENGVHGCVTSAVQVLSEPGDKIFTVRSTWDSTRILKDWAGRRYTVRLQKTAAGSGGWIMKTWTGS